MSILGSILKGGLAIRKKAVLGKKDNFRTQKRMLKKLLTKARHTEFGKTFHFDMVLKSFDKTDPKAFYKQYCRNVPVFNYNQIAKDWWKRSLDGEPDITWPGTVKYFALSSGTSEASTKHIPVTKSMIKAIQRTSIRQILTLPEYNLPSNIFTSGIMLLGGSTNLKNNGIFFEGDLSGIQASQLPLWFQQFYKPGKKIAKTPDWNEKLDEITRNASKWDIGYIAGVPAWVQMLMQRIIIYYQVDNIHQVWPNLSVYCHGGVSFEPYKKSFETLLGKPLVYLETYLASEGFIAYQAKKGHNMKLVLDNGLFMEFIPFNEENFNADGDLVANPSALMIDEVEENKDYALLLSTCAGAWRYLIGDVIRFTNKKEAEIIITGRTKHYISLCGEHLSVENMSKAVSLAANELNIRVTEFAVAGKPSGSFFAHEWYIGTDDNVDANHLVALIDEKLKILNDDYRTERIGPLEKVTGHVFPVSVFYDFMRKMGKEGGQNKFPRVLRKTQLEAWDNYLLDLKKK